MKILKLALVVCGVVGLAAVIAPLSGFSMLKVYFDLDPLAGVIQAAIFALPLAMGVLGLARPPIRSWQAGVALSACVVGVVRFRLWDIVTDLPGSGLRDVLVLAMLVIGTVASVTLLMRPEMA